MDMECFKKYFLSHLFYPLDANISAASINFQIFLILSTLAYYIIDYIRWPGLWLVLTSFNVAASTENHYGLENIG